MGRFSWTRKRSSWSRGISTQVVQLVPSCAASWFDCKDEFSRPVKITSELVWKDGIEMQLQEVVMLWQARYHDKKLDKLTIAHAALLNICHSARTMNAISGPLCNFCPRWVTAEACWARRKMNLRLGRAWNWQQITNQTFPRTAWEWVCERKRRMKTSTLSGFFGKVFHGMDKQSCVLTLEFIISRRKRESRTQTLPAV